MGSIWLKSLALVEVENNELTAQKLEASTEPFLLFPEEETTSGEKGLLSFSAINLPVDTMVQPIAIKVSRPFLHSSVVSSSIFQELMIGLFVPNTHFTLTLVVLFAFKYTGLFRLYCP